jgi:uncharacterized protein with PQ loop repeat
VGVIEILGWSSSLVLVLTIGKQVLKQWREDQSAGVSRWLFVGQLAASLGFTAYSALVGNAVFVVTNVVLAASALLGLLIVVHHRRRARRYPSTRASPSAASGDCSSRTARSAGSS